MIKLYEREMRSLSRILTLVLCCAPAFVYGAGPVATTSGSNLTAYNPSTAYNNQWASLSNGRYDNDNTAKVDFGNCNAVVLRCAQPKCANGGCTDYSVAGQIVSGCVKSNSKCKQYGDDLVNYMTAQLVANSNAKVNEQQMALEQARIQAEAQAAATAAANSQNEQMISQMQNQMYQMQQQMAQQQAESAAQLQEALAQQQAQSAAALESMRVAATESAQQTEAGITSYQQEAINRGISEDVLARKQVTGQIMTEIENADLKLKEVKTAMQNAFDYAKCDARGNNCVGPKRVKKWRELARGFTEPYTDTLQDIYNALMTAQTVGVDLSQIYMMLNNSCNQWGQYLCEAGDVTYPKSDDMKQGPAVCNNDKVNECIKNRCNNISDTTSEQYYRCTGVCTQDNCSKCRLVKMLTDQEEVYAGWIDADKSSDSQRTVVSCASGALQSSTLFAPLLKNRKDSALVNMENLEKWLDQVEPGSAIGCDDTSCDCNDCNTNKSVTKCGVCYCGVDGDDSDGNVTALRQAAAKKSVYNLSGTNKGFCVKNLWKDDYLKPDSLDECSYINPIFAICDTHPYNAKKSSVEKDGAENEVDTEFQEKMNEIIGLKVTVISQQMYKQYEYLRATLQRLKIQLEKAVLTSNLEAAGAKEDGSSSSSGLLGSSGNKDKTIVLSGAINCSYQVDFDRFVDCVSGNVQNIIRAADGTDKKNACLQLQYDLESVHSRLTVELGTAPIWSRCGEYMVGGKVNTGKSCKSSDRDNIKACANEIITRLSITKRNINKQNKSLRDLLTQ